MRNNQIPVKFSSLSESGFIPTYQYYLDLRPDGSCSHLFQRVASFLLKDKQTLDLFKAGLFSSLSESGFIPTTSWTRCSCQRTCHRSHLFQRVASFLLKTKRRLIYFETVSFSSLSESGFIPTSWGSGWDRNPELVLISFREWLHSYEATV